MILLALLVHMLLLFNEPSIILIMIRSWLVQFLLCFSHSNHRRKKLQGQTCPNIRKVRYRIPSHRLDNSSVTQPLMMLSLNQQQSTACYLNESQNCAEISQSKRSPSLIAINIDEDDFSSSLEQSSLACRLSTSNNSLTMSSRSLSLSFPSIRKQISDSTITNRQRKHSSVVREYNLFSKQALLCSYSSYNINSIIYDSPSNDTPINLLTPNNQIHEKSSRLEIHDDLNKDGSRHFVVHKGSEELIRKRREEKRAKRSEEKKRRIQEKILQANQRWQKYSNIDYELVFFISRYYDQLPLCSKCLNYFATRQTQFLTDNPRASLDYAAEAVLNSPSNKSMSMKQAAKARLIKDYDKQTDTIFNLCDTCLTKCERIRNELKQINLTKKMLNTSNSPNTMTIPMTKPDLQSPILSPSDSLSFSPSPVTTNSTYHSEISHTPPQNETIIDLNQIYFNNLLQNHQIKLQQLYEQSQNIICSQQYYPLDINQQQLQYDLQACVKEMQYHCLEILHLQYPGYSLSFPYLPSQNPQYLSYRHEEIDSDDESPDTQTSSLDDESDSTTENSLSTDDRLTIETCHGLVEYCNAPLDDFIRGIQVLKCLSNFNCYSSV